MENFLQQLTQAGALNIPDPMKAYQNALAIKSAHSHLKTSELDQEGKVLSLGKEYLQRVENKDEYPMYRDYMVNKLGMRPELLPESFETDEEFERFREKTVISAEEMMKLKLGRKATLSKLNSDGTISKVDGTQYQIQGYIEKGLINPKEGWQLGEITGKPEKTEERLRTEERIKAQERSKAEADKQSMIKQRQLDVDEANKIGSVREIKTTGANGKEVIKTEKYVGQGRWEDYAESTRFKDGEKGGEVTWTSASKFLSSRFGKQDAVGNFVFTKELQERHKLAQKKLAELKAKGEDPLAAVNKSEYYANMVESNYWTYLEDIKGKKDISSQVKEKEIKDMQSEFEAKYGYIPRTKM